MKLRPIPHLLVALALAVILPLEQARCAWMGMGSTAGACSATAAFAAAPASTGTSPAHACCRAQSACSARSNRAAAPVQCLCAQIPAGTLPATLTLGAASSSQLFIAAAIAREFSAPVSLERESLPALDIGSPPLPSAVGAHLLRAPPVSA